MIVRGGVRSGPVLRAQLEREQKEEDAEGNGVSAEPSGRDHGSDDRCNGERAGEEDRHDA